MEGNGEANRQIKYLAEKNLTSDSANCAILPLPFEETCFPESRGFSQLHNLIWKLHEPKHQSQSPKYF